VMPMVIEWLLARRRLARAASAEVAAETPVEQTSGNLREGLEIE